MILICSDSDRAIRELLARYPAVRDLEVAGAGLEDAFLQLTADSDTNAEPAGSRELQEATR